MNWLAITSLGIGLAQNSLVRLEPSQNGVSPKRLLQSRPFFFLYLGLLIFNSYRFSFQPFPTILHHLYFNLQVLSFTSSNLCYSTKLCKAPKLFFVDLGCSLLVYKTNINDLEWTMEYQMWLHNYKTNINYLEWNYGVSMSTRVSLFVVFYCSMNYLRNPLKLISRN